MIAKVSHSGTVQAGSFNPVRKHPLMSLCSESGPNEAQPRSALQPPACSHHQLPNSQLNSCPGRAPFMSQAVLCSIFQPSAEESSLTHVDGNHLVMNLAPKWGPTCFSCPMTPSLTRANPWCCSLFPRCHVPQALAAMEGGAFLCSIPAQALSHWQILVTVIQGPSKVTGKWVGEEQTCQA